MPEDGYVKFHCLHTPAPALPTEMLSELNCLRTDLVRAGLVGSLDNGIGYGNVSMRWKNGTFLVTATSTGHIPVLGPEGYCLVTGCDLDANAVWCEGVMAASSESMTHAAVYDASSVACCVVHIHHKVMYQMLLDGHAPATRSDASFGTPAMAKSVAELVRQHPADGVIAMTGHPDGIILYAPSIDDMRDLLAMLAQGYIPA